MQKSVKRDLPLQIPEAGKRRQAPNRKQIAALGEEAVCRHFLKQGYRLVCRNWRSGRFGEIDLIVESPEGTLVFIEVKTRRRAAMPEDRHDGGFECIDWRKQRKILICMRSFLARNYLVYKSCRADVCVVYYAEAICAPQMQLTDISFLHVPNAFDASS